MVAVPAATPVTTPVPVTTVAVPGALLLHVPPAVLLDMVIEWPVQTDNGPVIEATAGFTVTTLVAEDVQPKELATVAVYVTTVVAVTVVG